MSLPERIPNHRYEAYLRSPEWAEKRAAVLARARGRCEVDPCVRAAAHVHHTRYPKVLGDEALSDLLAVCVDHHDLLHGVLPMNLPTLAGEIVRFPTPGGRELEAIVHDGHPYASRDAWFSSMRVPRCLHKKLSERFDIAAIHWQNNTDAVYVGQFNGVKVYRWHVVMLALQNWFGQRSLANTRYSERDPEEERFIKDYWKILQWIGDLASKDVALRMRGGTPLAPQLPAALTQAIATLAELQKQTLATTDDHAQRIGVVEHIVRLDGADGITSTEACLEIGVDPYQITRGRLVLAQDVGTRLSGEGAEKLGEKMTRFPDSGLTVPVALWRRRDAYRIIGLILGRDFLSRLR